MLPENRLEDYLNTMAGRYPLLTAIREEVTKAYRALEECYRKGGKLLVAGNGGSACDAEHIVAELMKGFLSRRELNAEEEERLVQIHREKGKVLAEKLQYALPALALTSNFALNTAFANDVDGRLCFAQQVYAYGEPGDVFLGITTSGNSENVLYAAVAAKAKGMNIIGFTGKDGGEMGRLSDFMVRIPCVETWAVQEAQIPVYHCWCRMLEESCFGCNIGG